RGDVLLRPGKGLECRQVGGIPASVDYQERLELVAEALLRGFARPPIDEFPRGCLALALLEDHRRLAGAAAGAVDRAVRLPMSRHRAHLPPPGHLALGKHKAS